MATRQAIVGVVAVAALASCTAAVEFDPDLLGEDSAQSCTDELDNDGDGLADCQDFGCLTQAACCDVPTVVIDTAFETESCGPPNEEEWSAWGSPLPTVCEGVFRPSKSEACYDVGAIAKQAVSLREGMAVVADVVGRPEPKGRLVLALTFQSDIVGSLDPCAPIEGLRPFVFLMQEPVAGGGYRWSAGYDQASVGVSPLVNDDGQHTVSMHIGDDGRIEYSLDGEVFATSADSRVVEVDRPAHVAVAGRGFSAGFTSLTVVSGNQCETPERWTPAEPFLVMDATEDHGFDSLEVLAPVVVEDPQGDLELIYTGCDYQGTCDVGRAHSTGGAFLRDPNNPILINDALWWYRSRFVNEFDGCAYTPYGEIVELCDNPTSISGVREVWEIVNGSSIFVWHSGRSRDDGVYSISLVTSNDGGATFELIDDVVPLSGDDTVDGRGVRAPTVIYDQSRQLYQMWFAAEGSLGATTSIGYAVSVDGIEWHRYPEPVVRAEDVGLETIGRPSVLFDGAKLRMFVEGTVPGDPAHNIYELVNRGLPYDEPP